MAHKTQSRSPKPYPLDWLLRFGQSLILTAMISFCLATIFIAGLTLSVMGLHFLPGLSSFASGITGTTLHVLSIFGGGEWWQGILAIATPISIVSVLFDAFVFLQNHGQEALNAWNGVE